MLTAILCIHSKIVVKLPGFNILESHSNINQGGHKLGKHGKPGKLGEFEKLSKCQEKLKEI